MTGKIPVCGIVLNTVVRSFGAEQYIIYLYTAVVTLGFDAFTAVVANLFGVQIAHFTFTAVIADFSVLQYAKISVH